MEATFSAKPEAMEAAAAREIAAVENEAMDFLVRLRAHALQNPEPIFALLRRVKPILLIRNFALVTRFDDVQEVLSRDAVFPVTYAAKMRVVTGGNDFFLGMQDSPEYTRDVAHMRTVIRREDIPGRVAPFVAREAEALLAEAGPEFDIVEQLTRKVPARWAADYFGCPTPPGEDVADWASAIFQYLFTDLDDDPAVAQAAEQASQRARDWLDRTIANRKANPDAKDDVLNRCLALQAAGVPAMTDLDIRNNLIGLLTGAIPTT
ncbi:MAG: hypothetical protein ACRD1E_12150, partial [Terriglobales bacterium]